LVKPRAILAANLYLNLLLSANPDVTAVGLIFKSATQRSFDLLLPEGVVEELRQVVARRPYLAARVSQETLDALFVQLLEFATLLPLLEQAPPRISRDPNDDYLVALAVVHEAEFLVTRDRDLLSLGEVVGVRMVDPVAFLDVICSIED